MSSLTGRILGDRYRLLQPLHEGGMGSVWLAEHVSLGSPLAVKLMAEDVARTEERLQRFLREARAAAALHSPHVVQIFDHGVDAGIPFIAMELLRGESLAARLRRTERLDARETELVVRHVSRALGQAHDIGIVHRDLTPANIFITRNADEEMIKLLDFGIAKATDTSAGSFAKQTRTGSFLGTPAYVSPEQLEASNRCDHRTDIWALGVITFECLLGRMPFGGAGISGLVLDICSRPLPCPSALGAVPEGFDAWFFRACARDLDERFSSIREAAAALRALVEADRGASRIVPSPVGAPVDDASRPAEPGGDRLDTSPSPVEHANVSPATLCSTLPSSTLRSSAGISITSAASSVTVDRPRARHAATPGLLLLATVALLVFLFAWRGLSRPSVVAEPALQALQPPAAAGLEVLGEGGPWLLAVDGEPVGPLPQHLQGLDPGEHRLRITGQSHQPFEASVTLAAGVVTRVGPVALDVVKRIATIEPGPGAEGADVRLKVGDDELRLPPLPTQIEVDTTQPHVLLARRQGYAAYEQALSFAEGQGEKSFVVSLAPLPGPDASPLPRASARRDRTRAAPAREPRRTATASASLTLDATPDCAVLLDGTPLGTTPLHAVPVAPGTHRILFISGVQRQARVIKSVAGKNRVVSATFTTARTRK